MQVMTVNRGLENPVIRNRHRDVLLTVVEELAQAEDAFLALHGGTEVRL
jgi:hypothetical protein